MNAPGLITLLSPLLLWSCASPQRASLNAFNPRFANNRDDVFITGIDGRPVAPPKEKLTLTAGKHTITFSVSYMREGMQQPITAEVSVTADFVAGHEYRAMSRYHWGFMGVMIDEPHTPSDAEMPIAGATLIWSAPFHAHSEEWNRRFKQKR